MKLTARTWWCIGQFLALLVAFPAFFVWAPWMGATARDEASSEYRSKVSAECPAIAINHGHVSCFQLGTVTQNPRGFALCTAILFFALAFFIVTNKMGRGFASISFAVAIPEVSGSAINAIRQKFGYPKLSGGRLESCVYTVYFLAVVLVILYVVVRIANW